eukprot:m.189548 g.189548  ORF g.189548 m.189548 type:complete len:118 (-) comp14795_c0_seq1:284-637(-)
MHPQPHITLFSLSCLQFLIPIATIAPPIIVAFCTKDVETLVSYTGSYAGVGIQYIFPALLCLYGRKKLDSISTHEPNHHRSWFRHNNWVYFTLAWSAVCIALVTYNHIADAVNHHHD